MCWSRETRAWVGFENRAGAFQIGWRNVGREKSGQIPVGPFYPGGRVGDRMLHRWPVVGMINTCKMEMLSKVTCTVGRAGQGSCHPGQHSSEGLLDVVSSPRS